METKNPVGYIAIIAFQYMQLMYSINVGAFCVAMQMGTFMFMISMTKDIQRNLSLINENTKPKQRRKQIPKQIIDFIEFHSIAKQLSKILFPNYSLILPHKQCFTFFPYFFLEIFIFHQLYRSPS